MNIDVVANEDDFVRLNINYRSAEFDVRVRYSDIFKCYYFYVYLQGSLLVKDYALDFDTLLNKLIESLKKYSHVVIVYRKCI